MVPNVADFPAETVRELNKNLEKDWNGYSLGRSSSSMGLSMDSLSAIFTEVKAEYQESVQGNIYRVDFDAPVDGNQADFVYVEFKDMDQNFQYTLGGSEYTDEKAGFLRLLMKKDYNPGLYAETLWAGNLGLINKHTAAVLTAWLEKWEIPYDEIVYGKVWPGHKGFYVDDRTIRPDEFMKYTPEELEKNCEQSRQNIED